MERGTGVSLFSPGFIAPGVGVGRKVPTGPAGSTTRGPCGPANPESNGASDGQAAKRPGSEAGYPRRRIGTSPAARTSTQAIAGSVGGSVPSVSARTHSMLEPGNLARSIAG